TMAKAKTSFFCQNGGYGSAKWLGKCPSCNEWNTFVEELVARPNTRTPDWRTASGTKKPSRKAAVIREIAPVAESRRVAPDRELTRVLGGGIVRGSVVLIGGEPGSGKCSLMLQLALTMKAKTLYVSGEESEPQLKMRAERIAQAAQANCYILTETATANIFAQGVAVAPDLVVIDAIQTLHSPHVDSAPGSVSQVRECTAELLRFAKETDIPVIIVGHITKDGSIAGRKVLEHMVDNELQFEGVGHHSYRVLSDSQ